MPTVTVNTSVDGPEPVYAHADPSPTYSVPAFGSGNTKLVQITNFRNNGNVPINLVLDAYYFSPELSLVSDSFRYQGADHPTNAGLELAPSTSASLEIMVQASTVGVGETQPANFTIDYHWEDADGNPL